MSRVWQRIECNGICIMVVCLLCGLPIGFLGNMMLERLIRDDRFPVIFHRVEALNNPVPQNGTLEVRIFREKLRDDCAVKSEREAIRSDGKVFDLPDAIWEGGQAGTEYLDYGYSLRGLPVGNYALNVTLTYLCDNGTRVFAAQQPQVSFSVVSSRP